MYTKERYMRKFFWTGRFFQIGVMFFLAVVLFGVGCGGSATEIDGVNADVVEAGNPSAKPRKLEGEVEAEQTTAVDEACSADGVEVYDTGETVNTATIEADCTFELEVAAGKAWGIRFFKDDVVVAVMTFNNGKGLSLAPVYYTSDSDTSVNIGQARFYDGVAYAQFEPSRQNDQDGDGTEDYYDTDDDNDSLLDTMETDCDADGVINDLDLASEC